MNIHPVTECFDYVKTVSTVIFGLCFRNHKSLSIILHLYVQSTSGQPELYDDLIVAGPAVLGGIQRQFIQCHARRQTIILFHGDIGRKLLIFRTNQRFKPVRKGNQASLGFIGRFDFHRFHYLLATHDAVSAEYRSAIRPLILSLEKTQPFSIGLMSGNVL